jgi:hypothetical protein
LKKNYLSPTYYRYKEELRNEIGNDLELAFGREVHRKPWGRIFSLQTSSSARYSQGMWLPPLSATQYIKYFKL